MLREDRSGRIDFAQANVVAPEIGKMLEHTLGVNLIEQRTVYCRVAKQKAAITGEIDIDNLDIGIDETNIVLPRQFPADAAITPIVMDSINPDARSFRRIIVEVEHPHMPHQPRTEKLADKALVTIIRPDIAQHPHDVAPSGDIRKPFAVLIVRIGHDFLDVPHHCKSQRIRIEAGEVATVEIRLEDDIGVRLKEFEKIPV